MVLIFYGKLHAVNMIVGVTSVVICSCHLYSISWWSSTLHCC